MKKLSLFTLHIIVLTILSAFNLYAQEFMPVSTDSVMSFMETIASPETFQGRNSGTEGGQKAQTWIASRFEEWGLQPLIGTSVLVPYDQLATYKKKSVFSIKDTPWGKLKFNDGFDYTVATNSGSAKVTAPVTIIGYGKSVPERGWDDYGDVDVNGRIVVILRGNPPIDADLSDISTRTYLYPEAVKRGAVAVLFYRGAFPTNASAISEEAYNENVPALHIGDVIMRHIFYGTGESFQNYKRKLKESPNPFNIDKELTINISSPRTTEFQAYDVVGVVEGTDPVLKHEAVIIGAHGDHASPNADGLMFLGADDNGSGTACVMEWARVYAKNPQKRTMIFCTFGGEEQGLLGSKALAERLPDKYKYVTMVNYDMTGRGQGKMGIGGGNIIWDIWDPWYENLPDSSRENIENNRHWGGWSSDHAPFLNRGIPSFSGYSRGFHDFYHSSEDNFSTIERPAMEGTIRYSTLWFNEITNYPEPLADIHLMARTIWHDSYPLAWIESSTAPALDVDLVKSKRNFGFVSTVIELPFNTESDATKNLFIYLDHWKDLVKQEKYFKNGANLKDASKNAYGRNITLFYSIQGDSLDNEDSTKVESWINCGLNWLKLENAHSWSDAGAIRPDKKKLLRILKEQNMIFQLPLSDIDNWLPVMEYLGGNVIIKSDWDSFVNLPDDIKNQLYENKNRFVLEVNDSDIENISDFSETIKKFKIQIIPAVEDYDSILFWVDKFTEAGIEREVLQKWFGIH